VDSKNRSFSGFGHRKMRVAPRDEYPLLGVLESPHRATKALKTSPIDQPQGHGTGFDGNLPCSWPGVPGLPRYKGALGRYPPASRPLVNRKSSPIGHGESGGLMSWFIEKNPTRSGASQGGAGYAVRIACARRGCCICGQNLAVKAQGTLVVPFFFLLSTRGGWCKRGAAGGPVNSSEKPCGPEKRIDGRKLGLALPPAFSFFFYF